MTTSTAKAPSDKPTKPHSGVWILSVEFECFEMGKYKTVRAMLEHAVDHYEHNDIHGAKIREKP